MRDRETALQGLTRLIGPGIGSGNYKISAKQFGKNRPRVASKREFPLSEFRWRWKFIGERAARGGGNKTRGGDRKTYTARDAACIAHVCGALYLMRGNVFISGRFGD